MEQDLRSQMLKLIKESLPGVSIECVILGYEQGQLKTLLFQTRHEVTWSLPGGYIRKHEDIDEAAHRILEERTGLKSIFLKQFHTFGKKDRSHTNNREQYERIWKALEKFDLDQDPTIKNWMDQRLITMGYYALVDIRKSYPHPHFFFEKCEWVSVENLPELFLRQQGTVSKVLDHLRLQLNYLPIGRSLLPEKFTMQDLQKLYEIILKRPLVRSNFQRKMLSLGILVRLEKHMTGAPNKAPFHYCFDHEQYEIALKKGIGFTI